MITPITWDVWQNLGSKAFLALTLSGMMGNVFAALLRQMIAAGVIYSPSWTFGTIGALALLSKVPYIRHLSQSLPAWLWSIWSFSLCQTSVRGHIGGLVAGVMLAYVFPVEERLALWTEPIRLVQPISSCFPLFLR